MTPTEAELLQHLRGNTNAADARRIDDWLAESDDNRRRLETLRAIWNASHTVHDTDVDAIWKGVSSRTTLADSPRSMRPSAVPQLRLARSVPPHRSLIPIVAATAIVVAAVVAFLTVSHEHPQVADVSLPPIEAPREYATGRGERSTIHLADGTRVTLAPLTRVRVHPGFGVKARELTIEGEAILDVVHDTTHPFRVYMRDAMAEDIGTRFAVRSLAGDTSITVAVAEGAVSLGRRSDSTSAATNIIRAGRLGRIDANGHASGASSGIGNYFGWADGHVDFSDTPLVDVQRTLARWYDVDLRVADSTLRTRRVTARFDGQSIHAIVSALAITLGADSVEWRGSIATLRSTK
ncbi:MAG: FecR domain-containing protein [Gemmatimonadaceae bacterium]